MNMVEWLIITDIKPPPFKEEINLKPGEFYHEKVSLSMWQGDKSYIPYYDMVGIMFRKQSVLPSSRYWALLLI